MDDRISDNIAYRTEKAKEDLNSSKVLLKNGFYALALNRSYYAIFHAARTLLAIDKYASKKHSGVISYFNRNFILTKKVDKKYGAILKLAERIRIKSDHLDFYIASKEQAQTQIQNAEEFIQMVESYLSKLLES